VGHGGCGGGGAGISVLRGAPSPTSVLVGTGGQGGAGKSGHCATFTKGWQRGDPTHTLVCSFQCTVLCGSLNGLCHSRLNERPAEDVAAASSSSSSTLCFAGVLFFHKVVDGLIGDDKLVKEQQNA